MTIYLRTPENDTLVDITVFQNGNHPDIRSDVIIKNYSKFLLENHYRRHEIIKVFNDLSEIRGWLFEVYLPLENKKATVEDVIERVKLILKGVSNNFKLNVMIHEEHNNLAQAIVKEIQDIEELMENEPRFLPFLLDNWEKWTNSPEYPLYQRLKQVKEGLKINDE